MENHAVIVDLSPIRPLISELTRKLDEYEPELDAMIDMACSFIDDDQLLEKGLDAFSDELRRDAGSWGNPNFQEMETVVEIGCLIGRFLHEEFDKCGLYGTNHSLGQLQLMKMQGRDHNTLIFMNSPDEHY